MLICFGDLNFHLVDVSNDVKISQSESNGKACNDNIGLCDIGNQGL